MDKNFKRYIYFTSTLLAFSSFYIQGLLQYFVKICFPTSSVFLLLAIPNLFSVFGILWNHLKTKLSIQGLLALMPILYFISLFLINYSDTQKIAYLNQFKDLSYQDLYLEYFKFSNKFLFLFLLPVSAYYFLYGIFLSWLWNEFDSIKIRKIYSLDLLFSALGIISSCFLVEIIPLKIYLLIPFFTFSLVIWISSLNSKSKYYNLVLYFIVLCSAFYVAHKEWIFHPDIKLSSIAYPNSSSSLKLIDQKISSEAMLSLEQSFNSLHIQLDNGIGTVSIQYQPNKDDTQKWPQVFSSYNPKIKNVLILMAGAGADAHRIKQLIPNVIVDNVEVNGRYKDLIFKNFPDIAHYIYDDPNSRFYFEDARIFLEKNKKQYDSIIFSFHGSPNVNYLGAMSRYNDYLYTVESFSKAISSLTPEGNLIILSGNKIQVLTTLYHILGKSFKDNIVILQADSIASQINWRSKTDRTTLLFKKTPFDPDDLHRIHALANYAGYNVLYSPFDHPSDPNIYSNLLNSSDFNEELKKQEEIVGKMKPIFDDSPFFFRPEQSLLISTPDYWANGMKNLFSLKLDQMINKNSLQFFLLLLTPLSFLFYLLVNKQNHSNRREDFVYFIICLLIGMGYTLTQATVTTTYRLFFGGTTVPVLLCSALILIGLSIGAFFLQIILKNAKILFFALLSFFAFIYNIQIHPNLFWNNYSLMAPIFILLIVFSFSIIGAIFPYIFTTQKSKQPQFVGFTLVWDIIGSLIIFLFFSDLLIVFGNKLLFLSSIFLYLFAILLLNLGTKKIKLH